MKQLQIQSVFVVIGTNTKEIKIEALSGYVLQYIVVTAVIKYNSLFICVKVAGGSDAMWTNKNSFQNNISVHMLVIGPVFPELL